MHSFAQNKQSQCHLKFVPCLDPSPSLQPAAAIPPSPESTAFC